MCGALTKTTQSYKLDKLSTFDFTLTKIDVFTFLADGT